MPNYNHLIRMTDQTGILQFSSYDTPDPRSGYTLDDNARALLVALNMGPSGHPYARIYLDYLVKAKRPDGSWSNFMLDGQYESRFDSEDSVGRALLACSAAASSIWPDIAAASDKLFLNQVGKALRFTSPRGIAYSLVAMCRYQTARPNIKMAKTIERLSDTLCAFYKHSRQRDWLWFQDHLTYCNAIIPQSLFCAYSVTNQTQHLQIAMDTLGFLIDTVFSKGYLNIVGNQGWYYYRGILPMFDQQPVDAASMALACQEAYQCTAREEYRCWAEASLQWYRGQNIHGLSLYNEATGGCFDALTVAGVNENQGAEAVVSMLLTEQALESAADNVMVS